MVDRAALEEAVALLGPRIAGRRLRGAGALAGASILCLIFEEAPFAGRAGLWLACGPPDRAGLHPLPPPRGQGIWRRDPAGRAIEALAGAQVAGLACLPGERIVEVVFDDGRRILAECFGPQGLWALLDAEGLVRALARRPPPKRALALGEPYRLPGGGAPPPLPAGRAGSEDPPPEPAALLARADAFLAAERRAEVQARARALRRGLERERRGLRARLAGLEARRAAETRAAELRREAELLLTLPELSRRGLAEIEVPDWFEAGRPRRIGLDPKLDLKENAARRFARAKRLAAGAAHTERLLAETRRELARVESRLAALERAAAAGDLEALPAGAAAVQAPPARAAADPTRAHCRRFRSHDGLEILVGRSNRDNEVLTFRIARGRDLWLHAGQGYAGSHVVLRLARGQAPPQESLLDAATLALHFSKARGARSLEIIYTPVKEVRRPKGAPPGRVELRAHRTLFLRFEDERLARLLRSADS